MFTQKLDSSLLSDFPFHSLVYYVSECIPAIAWMEDQNDRKWLHLERGEVSSTSYLPELKKIDND